MRENKLTKTRNILLSALAAVTLAGTSVLPAMADNTTSTTDPTSTTTSFNKVYTLTMPSGEEKKDYASPAEKFTFVAEDGTENAASLVAVQGTTWNTTTAHQQLSDLASTTSSDLNSATSAEVKAATPPTITLSTASYAKGDASVANETSTGAEKAVSITADGTYNKPGVYYYAFHENAGTTAGVTYNTDTYYVAVTVTNTNSTNTVSAVKMIKSLDALNDKVYSIQNTYGAGKLTFTKKVAGNMGDTKKQFSVKVTLTAPTGKTVNSTINVTGTGTTVKDELNPITPDDFKNGNGIVTKTFTVQDGTSISLTNIPEGVNWLVKEDTYSGYATTYSLNGGAETANADTSTSQNMVAGNNDTVTITNTNSTTIDTGIFTSNAPYFLILGIAVIGGIVYFAANKKRHA